MDLSLTWRADYVLRAAVDLGRRYDGEWHKAADIADSANIPVGYVRQILRMLVQNGIAEARSGTTGGYRLGREPAQITILDVVEAGEGPLLNTRCVMRGSGCNARRPCNLHPVIAAAHQALREELRHASLASVTGVPRRNVAAWLKPRTRKSVR